MKAGSHDVSRRVNTVGVIVQLQLQQKKNGEVDIPTLSPHTMYYIHAYTLEIREGKALEVREGMATHTGGDVG